MPGDSTVNQLTFLYNTFYNTARRLILAKKFGLSSVTSARPMTVSATPGFDINFRPLVLQETSLTGSRVIFMTLYVSALIFELMYCRVLV